MLKVNTGDQKVEVNWRRLPIGTGEGPTVFNIPGGFTPVVSQNFLTNTTVPSWMDVSATTGNRMLYDSTGKLTYAPNNLVLNSATLSTQTVTVAVGVSYILSFYGTGSVALSGAATATVNGTGAGNRVYQKVTATTASLVLTVTGSVTSAQVEAVTYQTTPSTYNATTTAAYYGPRFDYAPSTLAAKGLLIEESRINLCTNSDNLGTSYTTGGLLAFGSGSTLNAATSPDGTVNADLITEDTTTGLHRIFKTITSVANTAYSFSFYVKNASGTRNIYAVVGVGSDSFWAKFNLSTGVVISSGAAGTGSLSSATIESVGNGYYRIKVSGVPSTTGTAIIPQICLSNTSNTAADISYAGDGTSGVYLFGLQYEAGSFATSYIPTTTASVTRAADIIKLSGAALTALQGAAGTFLEEMTLEGNKAAAQYGAYGNTVSPLYWDSLVVKATNGTNVLSSAQTAVVGTAGRGGLAWNASGRAISYSASAAVTDANSFGTIGSTVYLGSNNGANSLNGWVRALSFYNQRLSNATLATKTTVGGPL